MSLLLWFSVTNYRICHYNAKHQAKVQFTSAEKSADERRSQQQLHGGCRGLTSKSGNQTSSMGFYFDTAAGTWQVREDVQDCSEAIILIFQLFLNPCESNLCSAMGPVELGFLYGLWCGLGVLSNRLDLMLNYILIMPFDFKCQKQFLSSKFLRRLLLTTPPYSVTWVNYWTLLCLNCSFL